MILQNLIITFTKEGFLKETVFNGSFDSLIATYKNATTQDCLYVSIQRNIPETDTSVATQYLICDTRTDKSWRGGHVLIQTVDSVNTPSMRISNTLGNTSITAVLHRDPEKISRMIKKLEKKFASPSSLFTSHKKHSRYYFGLEYKLEECGVKEK